MSKKLIIIYFTFMAVVETSIAENYDSLDLKSAISLALSKNRDIAEKSIEIEQSEKALNQLKGNYYPQVKLDSTIFVWDKETKLSLGSSSSASGSSTPAAMPTPDPKDPSYAFEKTMEGLLQAFSAAPVIREQITGDLKVSLIEPITPLYAIHLGSELQEMNIKINQIKKEETGRQISYAVAHAYFNILQLYAKKKVVESSLTQLTEQYRKIESLVKGEMANSNDLLKMEVALSNVKQGLIKLNSGIDLSIATLAMVMGLPPDAKIIIPELTVTDLPVYQEPLEKAYEVALENRLEIKMAGDGIEMSRKSIDIAKTDLLPTLMATAAYQRTEGSSMAQKNSFFMGLILSWKIFDWGTTSNKIEEAGVNVKKATLAADKLKSAVQIEVKKSYLDYFSSLDAYKVSELTIKQAEEAFRIEKSKFDNDASPITELIDSEALYRQSLNNKVSSYFDVLIAHASLKKALGEPANADNLIPGSIK